MCIRHWLFGVVVKEAGVKGFEGLFRNSTERLRSSNVNPGERVVF